MAVCSMRQGACRRLHVLFDRFPVTELFGTQGAGRTFYWGVVEAWWMRALVRYVLRE